MWDLKDDKAVTLEWAGRMGYLWTSTISLLLEMRFLSLLTKAAMRATGATHKVCSPFDLVEKHEYKAWKWAVQNYISEDDLDEAVADGCTDIYSLAEHFGVPEDFMRKAVCWYTHGI